jgi:predicted membrane-bound spermidine synthase
MRAPAFPVFLTSAAILTIEVFDTRLFSIVLWSNFAFAVLSLALLGLGSSGLVIYLFPGLFRRERAEAQVAWLLAPTGLSLLASHGLILLLTRTPVATWTPVWGLMELIVAAMLPYFSGGLILGIIFSHFSDQIGRLYFLDLVGAALGAALVVPALYFFNGPALVPALGLSLAAAGAWFAHRRGHPAAAVASVASCALLASFLVLPAARDALAVRYAKGVETTGIELERWDPLARLTVTPGYDARSRVLTMDGGATTAILQFDGDLDRVSFLKGSILQLAYHLRRYDSSLIIGPGGGSDVLSSLVFGNRNITAVEVNRSTLGLVRNDLRAYSGGLYDMPGVSVQVGEGRAFVAGMKRKLDLIQATFIDTWAAAATGSHTLSEDYLYTVEGIRTFLDHLEDDGIFSASRWGGPRFGYLETYRIVGIANEALAQLGAADPSRHILVVQGPPIERLVQGAGYQISAGMMESMTTILVKRSPFRDDEIAKIAQVGRDLSFRPLWLAGPPTDDAVLPALFAARGAPSFFSAYYERTGFDISPVTDDRPFFFDMIRPQDYMRMKDRLPGRWEYGRTYTAIQILYQLLVALLAVVVALLGLPLLLRAGALKMSWPVARALGYFTCLGLGFIGIELGLIQKFSLFLGHPVYSLVVSLASILFFSGVGSFSASKVAPERGAARAVALVAVLVLYSTCVRPLTAAFIDSAFAFKCALVIAMTAVPAFFMGMLFPLGIASIRERFAELIPWAWAVNCGFSVLGGVASLFASMGWGYARSWYGFIFFYLLAAVLLRSMKVAAARA